MKTALALAFVVGGILIVTSLFGAIRSGVITEEDGELTRARSPVWFWVSVGIGCCVSVAAMLAGIVMLATP